MVRLSGLGGSALYLFCCQIYVRERLLSHVHLHQGAAGERARTAWLSAACTSCLPSVFSNSVTDSLLARVCEESSRVSLLVVCVSLLVVCVFVIMMDHYGGMRFYDIGWISFSSVRFDDEHASVVNDV